MTETRPRIEYYFSFISLWSYIGSRVFQDLVRRHDAEVIFKPINLLQVFAAGGGKPVKERPPQRQAYRLVEMQRWRDIRGIPLLLHPKFYPADPSLGHRMLLAAIADGADVSTFVHAGLKAVWADELNIADPDTLVRLADQNGLNGRALLERSDEAALHEQEQALTREAIDRQLFGAPYYFYRDEPFWGQDRLDMLDNTIISGRPAIVMEPISQ
ncbi:2-hydroxychromene-2-carboxylate isomerase [Agaricicola taiwanensis]|uniref:2-hydroxychromene-2-carboxylate isomerase n=1 Tax=Agaricicola taiwanensis TaxID=591372 RepID=A0A8J3DWC5_9RHOB|nr:2-hydroxychromene-2-carboxylate isomerase [Agaricicola taiwanensis]GGE43432.1 2-hydroxychromene-2-carboxylate isomerase [Agaricicola taiwanensis]